MVVKILTFFLMLLSTVNIRYGFVSFTDMILALFIIYLFLFKKTLFISKHVIVTFLVFFILYLLSAQFSQYSSFNDEITFYGFLYKYVFIAFLFLIFTNIRINEIFLYRLIFACWAVLIIWTFYYAFFLIGNPLLSVLIPNQVSFPGTGIGENTNADSHLFAYVLGCLGLYLTIFSNSSLRYLFLFMTIFAVLLTGSRNPLALFGILFIFYFLNSKIEKKFLISILLLITLPIVFTQFFYLEDILPTMRSLQFELLSDGSAGNRIQKLIIAVDEYMKHSLIFGQSVFGSSITWADGIHTILLIHFGPIGLILYLGWVAYLFINLYRQYLNGNKKALNILFLSIYIFMGLFITEFILTSRGAALVLIPLIILTNNLNNNSKVIMSKS